MHRFRSNNDAGNTDDNAHNAQAEASSSAAGPSTASSSTDSPLANAAQRARDIIRRPIASNNSNHRPSVRIRREPSSSSIQQFEPPPLDNNALHTISEEPGRRRSSSEPQRPAWYSLPGAADRLARIRSQEPSMPTVSEEPTRPRLLVPGNVAAELVSHLQPHILPHGAVNGAQHADPHLAAYRDWQESQQPPGRLRQAGRNIMGWRPGNENNEGRERNADATSIGIGSNDEEYDTDMVDLLDVIGMKITVRGYAMKLTNSEIPKFPHSQPSRTYKTLCSFLILVAGLIVDQLII
jgi:hypothetical protein